MSFSVYNSDMEGDKTEPFFQLKQLKQRRDLHGFCKNAFQNEIKQMKFWESNITNAWSKQLFPTISNYNSL